MPESFVKRWLRLARKVGNKCSNARYWIAHRTYDRYHVVRCHGLAPGYYDVDLRMLHACFGLLVDFVEVELAHWEVWHEKRTLPLRARLPFRSYRSSEDGLRYLEREIDLVNDPEHGRQCAWQSEGARKARLLYLWWARTRPARLEGSWEIDQQNYAEDTEMLKRLADVRGYLWT